jgi:long-chain acyl-CoA synthetase
MKGRKMNWNYARYGLENINKFGEYASLIYEEEGLEQSFTNVQIQRQSNAMANGLKDFGVKRGEIVAVILPNGPAVPVVYTGIFKMGAVFLPINFGLAPQEIRYILEDSQATTIITDENLYPKVGEASRGLKGIRNSIVKSEKSTIPGTISLNEIVSRFPDDFEVVNVAPDELAVLMYTAGTTGFPKGVMLSHHNIGSNLEDGLRSWPQEPTDTVLTPLPLNHIYGLLMANECNLTGAKLVLHKWFEPHLVLNSIKQREITQFVGVPTMYIKLLENFDPTAHRTDSVRRWISAAAPLSIETLRSIEKKLGGRLFQGYGMTEASPTISRQREGRPRKPGSVGTAIDGVEIRILDQTGQGLPAGQVGEICVRGPNVMIGYLKKEEETREALKDGWLRTGDMGYLDSDGDLFITDRKKDLIIRGGENISPASIEEILYKHPAVQEAAVVGVLDPVYGEEVKAFVALRPGLRASEQELIDHCLRFTSRFMAPKSIAFLDELPKSSVGKILKKDLREDKHAS